MSLYSERITVYIIQSLMQMKQHNLARLKDVVIFQFTMGQNMVSNFHGDESQGRHHNSPTTLLETNRKFAPKNGWL